MSITHVNPEIAELHRSYLANIPTSVNFSVPLIDKLRGTLSYHQYITIHFSITCYEQACLAGNCDYRPFFEKLYKIYKHKIRWT